MQPASFVSDPNSSRRIELVALAITLFVGIFLRLPAHDFESGGALSSIAALHPEAAFKEKGFDEGLYAEYTNKLDQFGLSSYPLIVKDYVERQERLGRSILSPLRFLYIFSGYVWHRGFGSENLQALKNVASLFSILTLCVSTVFAWRFKGPAWALGIAVLIAVAPTQLHMSQHALVDGFFTFWAILVLWLFWENLRAPNNWRWLSAYVVALALLVVTKENSFFVWIALVALLVVNRWLQFGTVGREIILATFIGPLVGMVMLILLAGGIPELIHTYRYSMAKNLELPYAISTGDGPWFRYLIDLMLVSPIVLILALGSTFRLDRSTKMEWFFAVFIAASYLVMCNVKYGMNLRYANMWDLPLRFLALSEIVWLASLAKQFRNAIVVVAVVLLASVEFHQYIVLAVRYPLYELITHDLLEALKILKPM